MLHPKFSNKTIEAVFTITHCFFAGKKKRALKSIFRSEPYFNSFCLQKLLKYGSLHKKLFLHDFVPIHRNKE